MIKHPQKTVIVHLYLSSFSPGKTYLSVHAHTDAHTHIFTPRSQPCQTAFKSHKHVKQLPSHHAFAHDAVDTHSFHSVCFTHHLSYLCLSVCFQCSCENFLDTVQMNILLCNLNVSLSWYMEYIIIWHICFTLHYFCYLFIVSVFISHRILSKKEAD